MSGGRPRPSSTVSVVTGTLNGLPYLEQTIRSVANQRYRLHEHIVVDGGSLDGTVDLLRAAEVTANVRWISEPDRGLYDAVNKGLRMASGEILAYLNSDDLYLPWTLEVVAQAFAALPDVDLIYGDAIRLTEPQRFVRPFFQAPHHHRHMMSSGSLIQPAVFWRRRTMDRIGSFDPDLRFAGDLDFWLRAGEAGLRFGRVDEFLAVDRAHPGTLSASRYDEMAVEIVAVRTRHRRKSPTRSGRLVGRARREAWARRLWLDYARTTRTVSGDRWARSRAEVARQISIPAALMGTLPAPVGPSVQRRALDPDRMSIATGEAEPRPLPPEPVVSVITPSFQQGRWIGETIRSVREQSWPWIEHIVVDGGSTDGTLEILRAAEAAHGLRWIAEPDQGQADAINKGVRLATGDIVTWLNSDDLYATRDALERVVERFRSGAQVVTGAGVRLDESGQVVGRIPVHHTRANASTLRRVDWLLQPATFYTRDLALRYPLDASLHYAMDWDLFARLAAVARIQPIDHPIAGYRIHRAGKTVGGGEARQRELLEVLTRYNGPRAMRVRLYRLLVGAYARAARLPGRAGWLGTRALNRLAWASNIVTGGRGLPM